MKTFGKTLEQLRRDRHLTREELCQKIDNVMKPTALRDLENQDSIPRNLFRQNLIVKLADALNVSASFLIRGHNTKDAEEILKHLSIIQNNANAIAKIID